MTSLLIRRRRTGLLRIAALLTIGFVVRLIFFPSSSSSSSRTPQSNQIKEHNFIERATRPDKSLNVQRHSWLQARFGRDEREDLFTELIYEGMMDYWNRLQLPYILNKETASTDTQHIFTAIDQLLSLNGWSAALCPTLTRPFGQSQMTYEDLIEKDHLYYIAVVIHSADHFLVDQLAVIVQMARRLGSSNIFVSMLDYDSTDSTETLVDLCEAVLIMLNVPFRIRRVPGMTVDPSAAYYPAEEAFMRNMALEPLYELKKKRGVMFKRVVWLKGFTCPNDILETIKISFANQAAMVCGMDWAEHNGFFIFSDRWRTRDIEGDQFRQSKSSSKTDAVPPRDKQGALRYAQHLPFQVFCCESGTHVVDPEQSYYKGIGYRYGTEYQNLSRAENVIERGPNASCLDSSQAWFCRDLWVRTARDAMEELDEVVGAGAVDNGVHGGGNDGNGEKKKLKRRQELKDKKEVIKINKKQHRDEVKINIGQGADMEEVNDGGVANNRKKQEDPDANVGSDYDAMVSEEGDNSLSHNEEEEEEERVKFQIPNSAFRAARILVNPRCPTTYAGVSHTKLARDLFGDGDDDEGVRSSKYVLDDWEGAPERFICQEQKQTGGRKAPKTQRGLVFSIHKELQGLEEEEKSKI